MERNAKFILTFLVIVILLGSIGGYTYYRFRDYLLGPQLMLESPKDGSTVEDPLVTIQGMASNISFLTLNDGQIFVDERGTFAEKLLLAPGYNIMRIAAKDRFGRTVTKTLELFYKKEINN